VPGAATALGAKYYFLLLPENPYVNKHEEKKKYIDFFQSEKARLLKHGEKEVAFGEKRDVSVCEPLFPLRRERQTSSSLVVKDFKCYCGDARYIEAHGGR